MLLPTRFIRDKHKSSWYLGNVESCKHVVTLIQNDYSKMTADLKEGIVKLSVTGM